MPSPFMQEEVRCTHAALGDSIVKSARLWWLVHQWAGLKLSILLAFVFLTGTLAVFSHEIDWLLQPSLRVAPSSIDTEPDWTRIAAEAAAHPATGRIRSIDAPVASAFAASVTIERKNGSLAFLHAHPRTGVIQGVGPWVGAQRVLRNMHRHLNMPLNIGVPLVSALSLLMVVSVISSLIVYKRWWRGFFRPVRWREARTAWGDLHRLAGVWTIWFVLLIALTGIWYLAESLGLDAPPAISTEAPSSIDPADASGRLPVSLTVARRAFSDLRIKRIVFPIGPRQAFRFEGQANAILVRPRANAVWTDPVSTQIVAVRRGEQLSVHQRISEAADPLHFGTFAGYWSKIPWFLAGALLTLISVSGVTIFAMRLARRDERQTLLGIAWSGMGTWRWLAAGSVAVGLILMVVLFAEGGG